MKRMTLMLVALFSATLAFSQNFEIKMNLKGVVSSKIYVDVFGDKDATKINLTDGKTIAGADGKFTIKGTTTTQNVLRVYLPKDRSIMKMAASGGYFPVKCAYFWIVVSPDSKIEIKGDLTGKDFVDIYCMADEENRTLAELNSRMLPLINRTGNIAVILSDENKVTEAQKKELKEETEELDEEVAGIREDFIEEHPSSIAGLWMMEDMLIRSQIEPEELEPLLKEVDRKYHSNYFYQAVAKRIQGAKKAAVGARCPSIKGTDQNGNAFDIKDIKGKYVIIDFWGTWCSACLAGVPHMKAFRDRHADKLQIVGVAQDRDVAKWKKCIDDKGMNWPNIMQGKGESDFVAKFNVQGYPTKILISPDGKILYRESGENEDFYEKIEELMGE